jgi:hypothetical protein
MLMRNTLICTLLSGLVFFSCQRDADGGKISELKLEGFGSGATGGKGQPVVHVTNLNASGTGSLLEAMGSNKTIVFDIGGTITDFRWSGEVSNLTIDGSTAPSPGITLDNNDNGDCMSFDGGRNSNIIIRNIRARNAGNDGFNCINGAHDIVFDHCSSSGNRDGNLDITTGSYNISVQYCILGGGAPNTPGYSGTMLIGYSTTRNISVHHNLFSSTSTGNVGERNPMINWIDGATPSASEIICDFRNNLVWKWGRDGGTGSGYGTAVCYKATANIINNYYYSSSFEASATNTDDGYGNGATGQGYVDGNVSGNTGLNPNSQSNHTMFAIPFQNTPTTQDACKAAAIVIAQAGPRPLDATDQALISAVTLINCP